MTALREPVEKAKSVSKAREVPGQVVLVLQGGGALGLTEGEVNLPAMKRIPFLPTNALRLLVTDRAIEEFFGLLARIGAS